jgi:probable phosphoglycerate mutase
VDTDNQLWLIRHGATEWSGDGRHTGTTDLPLTPEGEDDARALRPRLSDVDFSLVLTSPLQRARRTAELAGFPDADEDEDLVEWGYGEYEGITTEQIRETVPEWTVWSHPSPGGETAAEVGERLDRVLARVRAENGNALLVSHGHALRALAARWLGLPVEDGRLLKLDTGRISVLGYERETAVIERWNS